jgi:hypothetical protein
VRMHPDRRVDLGVDIGQGEGPLARLAPDADRHDPLDAGRACVLDQLRGGEVA